VWGKGSNEKGDFPREVEEMGLESFGVYSENRRTKGQRKQTKGGQKRERQNFTCPLHERLKNRNGRGAEP